jgi:Flp pilus assembly protein TadD
MQKARPPDPSERQAATAAALLREGRLVAAVAPLRAALARSDRPDWQALLGAVLAALGERQEAEALLRTALARRPALREAEANLANLLRETGRHAEAAALAEAALARNPGDVGVLTTLGACRRALGDLPGAEAALRQALALRPDHPEALANLGATLRAAGDAAGAVAALRAALRHKPALEAARLELGAALMALDRPAEAAAAYAALPGAEGRRGLGLARLALGDLAGAEAALRAASRLAPRDPEAWNSLGDVLRCQGDLAGAEAAFAEALALAPGHAGARTNRGMLRLLQGRWAEGFADYESRWQAEPWRHAARHPAAAPWQGEALAGRTLLLWAEQGLGDTLQFARFAALLPRDGRILLEAPAPLIRLLEGLAGVDAVLPAGEPLPPFDLHCPLMSLPARLGTTLADLPGAVPYLAADPAPRRAWLEALPPGRRVGLAWAGNPRTGADRRRSIALAQLAPLALPGVVLVPLQVGPGAEEAPPPGMALHAPDPPLGDMADTAALVAGLDLVIAVDTAVAHLAGALGRPVWLLNRFDTCWRWLETGETTPWYPSMRILRQPRPGAWEPVIAAAAAALASPEWPPPPPRGPPPHGSARA